jgi:hypothetical protein
MSLIRWQPFHELDNLRNQMNHLVEELKPCYLNITKSKLDSL